MIGDDIFFTVLRFRGNQVSLGFDAPASFAIHRDEIYKKLQAEKNQLVYAKKQSYSSQAKNELPRKDDPEKVSGALLNQKHFYYSKLTKWSKK